MKNIVYLSLATLVLGFGSCSNEMFEEGRGRNGNDQFTAVMPSVESRTAMRENSVLWSVNDHIGVIAQNEQAYSNNDYELTKGADTQSAEFSGSYTGTLKLLAYYPYNSSAVYDGTAIKFSMPATHTYSTDNPKSNNGAPMACKISAEVPGKVSFKNAGALIDITINNIPEGYNQAVLTSAGTDAPNLAGEVEITFDAEGNPTLKAVSDAEASKTITINFTAASTGTTQNLQFFFPVPAADYSELELSITKNGSDKKVIKSFKYDNKKINATPGTRLYTTVTIDKMTGDVPTSVENITAANEALKSSNSVAISEIKNEESPTIVLPKKDESAAETPVSIFVEKISVENKTMTIKEGTDTEGSVAAKEVNLSLGKVASNTSLDVNLANSTVTVSSTNGTKVDIDQLTAITSANTLIIDKGVTINKLIVKGGNVRVKNGSNIANLSRDGSNNDTSTIIYKENGASLPNLSSADKIKVIDAEVADLEAAFAKGESYTLTSDVDITERSVTVPADKTVSLDLNGHTITAANGTFGKGRITVSGNFTLKDSKGSGKIVAGTDYKQGEFDGGLITVFGEMTMESGCIYAVREDAGNKGQFAVVLGDGGNFTMNGGKIEAGWFAVSGNGTSKNNSQVKINGGELISTADYAIYLPQPGMTEIIHGTVYGVAGGITMNRGTLNISGDAVITSKGTGSTGNWGDGTGKLGAAAVNVNAKYDDCQVNISGGTLIAEANALIAEGQTNNKTIAITGGTFSDLSAMTYLAENANVNMAINKDCTMEAFNLTGNGQTIAVDLKEHTLTLSGDCESKISATASFKNGSIVMSHVNHKIYGVGGKLTFDKVHISGSDYALWVQGPDAALNVINGSKIEANYFPVSTNAGLKDNELIYGANAIITLKDSEFIGKETGFMNNVPAVVTIDNCKFSGNHQAALLRGGEYTITNSIFTLKAELASTHSENKHLVAWGAGNRAAFAGITIGNYKSSAYQYYSKVDMKKVTVTVEGENASSFPAMHICANSAVEKGVTLTCDNQCSFTSAYSPSVEYGTTNITVNDTAVIENGGQFIVPKNK